MAGKEKSRGIRRPLKIVNPVVEIRRPSQVACRFPLAVEETDAVEIRLPSGSSLAEESDEAAVGRIDRVGVPTGVSGRDIDCLTALGRDQPQVGVGRLRLILVMIRNETQFGTVRRKGKSTSSGVKGRAVPLTRGQIPDDLSGLRVHQKRVCVFPITPRRPVPVEQLVSHSRFEWASRNGVCDFLVACRVGAALGIDIRFHSDPPAVRRPHRRGQTHRKIRQFSSLSAIYRQQIKLGPFITVRDKEKLLATGRENRRTVVMPPTRHLTKPGTILPNHPDLAPAFTCFKLVPRHRKRNLLTVRAYYGRTDVGRSVVVRDFKGPFVLDRFFSHRGSSK